MKTFFIILAILSVSNLTTAQDDIPVCVNKTTHLVCPDGVAYLQVGDPSLILAEVVPDLPNLVRIKAVKPFDKESSLTIVCSGRIYSLILQYQDTEKITYNLASFQSEKAGNYSGGMMPGYVLKNLSDQILLKRKIHIHRRNIEKEGIRLQLKNIYLKNDAPVF